MVTDKGRSNFWAKVVLAGTLAVAPVMRPTLVKAKDGFSPTLYASDFAFVSYNDVTAEYTNIAANGPHVDDDGYVGTFSWSYSTSGGTDSVQAVVVYQAYLYDTTVDAWTIYDAGVVTDWYPANAFGTSYIDFFAGDGIPEGAFKLNAWVCTGTTTRINAVLGGSNGEYVIASAFDDDPMPDPEPSPGPYPGDNPPITHPELPPTGPIGPGSSS
jgi:hypothetical protein